MSKLWERLQKLKAKHCAQVVLITHYARMYTPCDREVVDYLENRRAQAIELAEKGHADAVDEIYEDMQVMRFLVEGWEDPLQEKFEPIDLDALMKEMYEVRQRAHLISDGLDLEEL